MKMDLLLFNGSDTKLCIDICARPRLPDYLHLVAFRAVLAKRYLEFAGGRKSTPARFWDRCGAGSQSYCAAQAPAATGTQYSITRPCVSLISLRSAVEKAVVAEQTNVADDLDGDRRAWIGSIVMTPE